MTYQSMPIKITIALIITIVLWASAFVGIRAALQGYSPGGLALFRFLVASLCMVFVFGRSAGHEKISLKNKIYLMLIGVVGLGWYSIAVNYGEITVASGISSFIISQSPIITSLFAILFLHEKLPRMGVVGMLISIIGVFLISVGEANGFQLTVGVIYMLIGTVIGGLYSVAQKPLLKNCNAIDATAYIIWGCTLSLLLYFPDMINEIKTASLHATCAVIYLGIFPAALAYVLWSYVLAVIPASRAANYLYFMPVIATFLGWLWLNEIPTKISLIGGVIALMGVWIVDHSYKVKQSRSIAVGNTN